MTNKAITIPVSREAQRRYDTVAKQAGEVENLLNEIPRCALSNESCAELSEARLHLGRTIALLTTVMLREAPRYDENVHGKEVSHA